MREFRIDSQHEVPFSGTTTFSTVEVGGVLDLAVAVQNGGPNAHPLSEATVLTATEGGQTVEVLIRPPIRDGDVLAQRVTEFASFAASALLNNEG